MTEWWTLVSIGVASVAGLVALVDGVRGRSPRDLTVLSSLGVTLVLVIQVVVAIVQPLAGNPPVGSGLEFWMYLITALAMSVGIVVWALIDRTRFATIGLGIVSLAIAVMVVRMSIIWTGA